jgi:glycosyltransferase involved in cell wall biosynthesis
MINTERIAVVIPAYNEEAYLRYCLDALSVQTVQPDTVFVVDNNSTDATAEVAQSYAFVTLLHEPVQGICAATKHGLDVAGQTHDILFRCDADCRPEPNWIEKVLSTLNEGSDIGAVTGPGIFYDTSRWKAAFFYSTYMLPYFWSVGLAAAKVPLFGSNMAIKAEAWKYISIQSHLTQRQDLHDDIDMTYHFPEAYKIRYERRAAMPISARPFRSLRSMKKRYEAGFASVKAHWPEQSPYVLYEKKVRKLLSLSK